MKTSLAADSSSDPILTARAAARQITAWPTPCIAFVLGGASVALALHLGRHGSRRDWVAWLTFNGLIGLSGFGLWWFSGRHMYYAGQVEHWGHRGRWGFPSWHSPANVCRWLLWRPCEIGNVGVLVCGWRCPPVGLCQLAAPLPFSDASQKRQAP